MQFSLSVPFNKHNYRKNNKYIYNKSLLFVQNHQHKICERNCVSESLMIVVTWPFWWERWVDICRIVFCRSNRRTIIDNYIIFIHTRKKIYKSFCSTFYLWTWCNLFTLSRRILVTNHSNNFFHATQVFCSLSM